MTKSILVVDNNRTFRTFLTSLLRKEGHTVHEAGDGVAALDILQDLRPDVVFVDLIMPGIGGDHLCRIIRRLPQLTACRVVVVSAAAAEFDFDHREVGADACIAKGPFHTTAFYIREVLRELGEGAKTDPLQKIYGRKGLRSRGITRELLAKTERLESILDGVSEGILEIARDRVVYANRTALEWLAIPVESLLGRTVPAVLEGALYRLSTSGGPREVEMALNDRWLAIRCLSARESGVDVLLFTDITRRREETLARKRLEDQLRQQTLELEAASERFRRETERRRQAEETLRSNQQHPRRP
ncbi:MAG: response regulator [Desulfobacteraceae bacterium]|nr:response regulator [Desulfobacteraceae bacterium]